MNKSLLPMTPLPINIRKELLAVPPEKWELLADRLDQEESKNLEGQGAFDDLQEDLRFVAQWSRAVRQREGTPV